MKLLLALFFGMMLFVPSFIHAAEDERRGLIVSPAFQEVVLAPQDQGRDFRVSLTNDTDTLLTLRVSVFDFGSLDESGGVAFLGASNDLEKKYALASWIRPEKDVLTLASGETGDIRVTIENRGSLGPGGHYGALTFKIIDDERDGGPGGTIAVSQVFTTLVFVKKLGGEIYGMELASQEYGGNLLSWGETLRLRFQNSGNVHLVPRGTVTVTDLLGRQVAKGIINEESALILPETWRIYPVRLRSLVPHFIPGRYTFDISYRYDGQENFATTTLTADFIPPAAMVFVLVPVALFGWYAIRQRRQKRRMPKAHK